LYQFNRQMSRKSRIFLLPTSIPWFVPAGETRRAGFVATRD
jgi:hypothetical protein